MDENGKQVDAERTERELDARALRALAHPLRVRILNILSTEGEHTASMLAAKVGESSGSTSYHLRALAANDLIVEVPDRGTARERWWRPADAKMLINSRDEQSPAARAAGQLVMTEMYRQHEDLLRAHLLSDRGGGSLTLSSATITAEEAEELSTLVNDVIDRFARRREPGTAAPGARTYTLRFDLIPLDSAPRNAPKEAS